MASKRRIRRETCSRKRRFETEQDAATNARRVEQNEPAGGLRSAYRCRFCGGFHFGHTPGQRS